MNEVSLIGRFVKPIVLKDLGQDRYVINNVLAVSRKRKSDGQQNADFIPIVIWGKVAQVAEKYCEKGNLVGVNGRLMSRQYVNQEGKTTFIVEIVVTDIHLVEGKRYLEET